MYWYVLLKLLTGPGGVMKCYSRLRLHSEGFEIDLGRPGALQTTFTSPILQ